MKPAAIQKINKIGKVGHGLALFAKVIAIIAVVVLVFALVVSFILPKGFLTIRSHADADIILDYGMVGVDLSSQTEAKLNKQIQEEGSIDFTLNSLVFAVEQLIFQDDTIILKANADVSVYDMSMLRVVLIAALLHLALMLVILWSIDDASKALSKCETPFHQQIIQKMQRLTWWIIPVFLTNSILGSLIQSSFTGNLSVTLNINITEVIVFLALLAMTYIFKYGAQLQQESDETL